MEQPILATEGGPALSLPTPASAHGQHVLLRVPDCTTRLQTAPRTLGSQHSLAAIVQLISASVRGMVSGWSRPRLLVLCSLGVVMITTAVALAAVSRNSSDANHADSAGKNDRLPISTFAGSSSTWTTTEPVSSAAASLDEAPPFNAASTGQATSNRPAKVAGAVSSGSSSAGKSDQPRKPTVGCAHIEQRIDRVPLQY